MRKGILKSIGKGIINGFPLLQSIITQVRKVKKDENVPLNNEKVEDKKFDIISLLTESVIVILIIAFVTGKITMEDLQKLIGIIKK